MIKEKVPAIQKLSKQEKIELAGELWDEAVEEDDIKLTEAQKEELDKRIKYAKAHPEEMIPWPKVREDILKKYGD